jgi:hypothetical protein
VVIATITATAPAAMIYTYAPMAASVTRGDVRALTVRPAAPAATGITVVDATTITATTLAHAAGAVDVAVIYTYAPATYTVMMVVVIMIHDP